MKQPTWTIRNYRPADCGELAALFYNTVHTVNAKDYTRQQLDAWAPEIPDPEAWNRSFLEHFCVVAEENGIIVGFGDIDASGYLDRLFVHADHQGRGIAGSICAHLEQAVQGAVLTHASITAKPFFERRGYQVRQQQTVQRHGVSLTNFVMEKPPPLLSKSQPQPEKQAADFEKL
jgi:putative acetyltransferase